MIWFPPPSVVLAGLLLAFGLPCRAADNGPAHFDPNALLGFDGGGSTLPVSTGPNGGAPPPAGQPPTTPAG
jgi:hypothetical protein